MASDIAWTAFDAGKYKEAADWFARSAELKNDDLKNARGYWEDQLATEVPEMEHKLDERIKDFERS